MLNKVADVKMLLASLRQFNEKASLVKEKEKLIANIPSWVKEVISVDYAVFFTVDPILEEVEIISSSCNESLEGELNSFLGCKPMEEITEKNKLPLKYCYDGKRMLAIPIKCAQEKYLLVLVRAESFSQEEEDALLLLAGKTDDCLDRLSVGNNWRDFYIQVIKALSRAIDARSPYTRGHSERVAEYAADIARALGWSKEKVALLKEAGLLHDIGKIAIPDAILEKTGCLTDDEYEIMKTHSQESSRILESVAAFQNIIPYVLHHHERYDGRGYPFFLKGKQIPLGAQILAVADTLDAMTSDRVYRKAVPWEIAIEEITENKGTQFSSLVVDALLQVIKDPTNYMVDHINVNKSSCDNY